MSEFMHAIFGGSDSSANQSASSTQTNYTDPNLQALAPGLADTLKTIIGSLGTQISNFGSGSTASTPTPQAPVTGQESDLLKTIGSQVGPGTASADYIKNVLAGNYLPGAPGGNPALAGAITAAQRPTLDNLTETLTRALPGRFAAAGQSLQPNSPGSTGGGSSAFDNAAALAFQSAANTSTDIASNIGSNAYTAERGNQNVAAGLDQGEVNNTISALQASALPRLIQQNGLDQGLSLFQTQITNLLQVLQTIAGVQAPTLAANSVSQGSSQATASKGIIPDIFKPV